MDEETEAQRNEDICSGSHSWEVQEQGFTSSWSLLIVPF